MCEKMFSIKQWIQAAVLVSVHLSGLYAQPGLDEDASFNSNLPNPDLIRTDNSYIREILNKMARKGDQYLTDNNITAHQILVIGVLSKSDVDAKKQDISDEMVKIVPNENIEDLPEYYYSGEKTVHGEILALYFKNTIDELLRRLGVQRNSRDTGHPYVFIFSHYIPCACLPNYHYSCAEELANLGRVNRNRYKIIVGYRSSWTGTNLTFAENLLCEGGIHILMNISSGQVSDRRLTIEPEIYQKKLTECLTNLTAIKDESAACFINTITKNCASGKDLHGYMTQFTKAKMHECVEEYVKGLPLELIMRYCSLGTLYRTMRLMLGRPTKMCEAIWTSTPDDLNWNETYGEFPETGTPEFPELTDFSKNLERTRRKCIDDRIRTESKDRLVKNFYQNEKLKNLTTDIDKKLSELKKDENESVRIRTRENSKGNLENVNKSYINSRDRHQ